MMKRFEDWLEESKPGDTIMYMQADHASRKPEVAEFFMKAAEAGKVMLYQRRVRPGIFNYHAKRLTVRAGKQMKPMTW